MKCRHLLFAPLFLVFTACAGATPQFSAAQIAVCFTPNGDCTAQIVNQINAAQKNIYVQAYSFTSGKIAYALVRAFKRGVDVKVILDKSNFNCSQFSFSSLLIRGGIPVWNDYIPNIAHNKVMIFDNHMVETGSFNFTKAAQNSNAENTVFIKSAAISNQFLQNWQHRQHASKQVLTDSCPSRHYY